jgi:FkbM family methyltransferase
MSYSKKTILISGSSDIGEALSKKFSKQNQIISTYNSSAPKFSKNNIKFLKLDIKNLNEIDKFSKNSILNNWENLIILPATQLPIGLANEVVPEDWIESININFTNQIYLLLKLLPKRSKKKIKRVILWSGTGSNNAPKYYSAYTVSKIALTKITEIFDAELNDCIFSVIGPGWVKTKIHNETLKNKVNSRENYYNTKHHFKHNIFNSIKSVTDCVEAILKLPKASIGGRNISVQFDNWRSKEFNNFLKSDTNIYKLRRDFNNFSDNDTTFSLDSMLEFFHNNKKLQNPKSIIYQNFKKILKIKIQKKFFKKRINFLGVKIMFPYIEMGNINSTHLFGIDELFLFKFYEKNKKKYSKVCDIGANIGLHSIILSKLGYNVTSFEPDPKHASIAKKNFKLNGCEVDLVNKAVSNKSGQSIFTRILGNTTGSFLGNKKTNAYGKLKKFKVNVENGKKIAGKFDLYKIDAEGSEIDILKCFKKVDLKKSDFVMEISTEKNAKELWNKFKHLKIYSQKNSWKRVSKLDHIPTSHLEGSIIISESINW